MGDFSRRPSELLATSRDRDYLGLHIEQGVPVLDRDLNLLHDLLAATMRATFARHIGDGLPAGAEGFAVQALPAGENVQNFKIAAGRDEQPGTCLVAGMEVTIRAAKTYVDQGLAPLTTPTGAQPDPRRDVVYLDVSVTEVDSGTDDDLANAHDIGMQTSVRLRLDWKVRVAEDIADNAVLPAPEAGHHLYPIAELRRSRDVDTIDASAITDLRQRRLTVSDLESRLSLLEAALLQPTFAQPPDPQIVPRSGGIGAKVTLSGNNFGNGSMDVLFGGTPAEVIDLPSAHKIQVAVPPGLTPGGTETDVRITVKNQIGSTTSTETFRVLVVPAFARRGNQFTPPTIAPGDRLTINGFNLTVPDLRVVFATTPETRADNIFERTPTKLVVEVPAATIPDTEVATSAPVVLRFGTREVRSDDTLRIERKDAAPTLDDPPFTQVGANVGQEIRLMGRNLNFSPAVSFNYSRGTVAAAAPTAVSPTTISVKVPAPPDPPDAQNPATVTVQTKGGSVTSVRQLFVRVG